MFSTRDLNALTDLDTSAASKDMATDNDRWISREASEVPVVFRTKNPAAVMVLGVISSEGHVMPPHFFEPKQKVNQEVYLELWIHCGLWEEVHLSAGLCPPPTWPRLCRHGSRKTCLTSGILRPGPPTPQISTLACATHHNSVEALKSSITSVAMSLEAAEVSRSVRAFRSRVETVVEAGGGHIE
ncbi:Transposable element tcb2 transposase [Caligus rogercresseyi]|uniref:Transposable element tcb2 transposase n=2 Tax=Caligus rogercresseyi TaxID=217165 RepID=A0A7T8K9X8_CALRO|nr:Transposable element tcb2 transposase [Caligus rogercresseyi]